MNSPSPTLDWRVLIIPAPVTDDHVRAALTALAGLAGQPRVVLEAHGHDGRVSWRLGAARRDMTKALQALTAHLPRLRSEPLPSTFDGLDRASLSASVRFAGERATPLKHGSTEPVVRGVLASLARARRQESVDVQLVLGPRRRPHRPRQTPRGEGALRRRQAAEHSFGCVVRVAAHAADPALSRSLINSAVAALRGLEAPGIRLQIRRTATGNFSRARSPWLWPNWLSVSDLAPLTAYPVGELPLPGVPDPHPILLPPTNATPTSGRPLGHAVSDVERSVALTEGDALRHMHVIGQTGTGKSELLARLALHDIEAGKGVCLIDPKNGLAEAVLERIPAHRLDDVVVLDPLDDAPVGINGLLSGVNAERSAETILGTLHALYADNWGLYSSEVGHAALLALARHGEASVAMLPLLLSNPGLRRSIIGRSVRDDPLGAGAWWARFEALSDGEKQALSAPLLRRLTPLMSRRGLRAVLGQRHPKFDIADVFTKQKILIVSLSRGHLGAEAAQLLGAIVVSLIWDAAMQREAKSSDRSPVSLIIDEVSLYLKLPGNDLGDALAMARSAGLQLTLAHQSLSQLDLTTKDAFLANARSRVMFQVSAKDARELAGTSKGQIEPEDLTSLSAFTAYVDLLVENSPSPWVSLATELLGPKLQSAASVRRRSRASYGQPLSEVEADLLSLTDLATKRPDDEPIGRSRRTRSAGDEGGAR